MNPLHMQVMMGLRDHDLLRIIDEMEHLKSVSAGLSPNEEFLLAATWERLDMITHPVTGKNFR